MTKDPTAAVAALDDEIATTQQEDAAWRERKARILTAGLGLTPQAEASPTFYDDFDGRR